MDIDMEALTRPSQSALRWLALLVAYLLILLFAIGIFDLVVEIYNNIADATLARPIAIIELIDTVLLLLIILEVHRTLIALVKREPVVRIIISVAIIAIARQIISFRIQEFEGGIETAFAAGSLTALLLVSVVAYVLVQRVEPRD